MKRLHFDGLKQAKLHEKMEELKKNRVKVERRQEKKNSRQIFKKKMVIGLESYKLKSPIFSEEKKQEQSLEHISLPSNISENLSATGINLKGVEREIIPISSMSSMNKISQGGTWNLIEIQGQEPVKEQKIPKPGKLFKSKAKSSSVDDSRKSHKLINIAGLNDGVGFIDRQ